MHRRQGINRTHRSLRLRLRRKSDLWPARQARPDQTVLQVGRPSRAPPPSVLLGCGLHNLHYYSCTPSPFLSLPQEHGPVPLARAAASRLEPTTPVPMSFPDWYNLRVCLILQKPSDRTACFEKTLPQHCKPTADPRSVEAFYHLRRADIFRYLDALQCHLPSKITTSQHSFLVYPTHLSKTSFVTVHHTQIP